MFQKLFFFGLVFVLFACQKNSKNEAVHSKNDRSEHKLTKNSEVKLTLENANQLAQLPLDCMQLEYPNKLDHVMASQEDIETPSRLHPAFYGCFDWHSSVHGHWSLVRLLKEFPDLEKADEIKAKLLENISKENIEVEVSYFSTDYHKSSERTYGWAWLLKLAEELHNWDTPEARILEENLQPLTDLMVKYYKEFLPKLTRPIRVGEHSNTAFALVFAYDYAETFKDSELKNLIIQRAEYFYLKDENCPIDYEPGGYDFLSPCFEEIDIMQRILTGEEFFSWLSHFIPDIFKANFTMYPAEVSDRDDGKLVHLDGLNFSRAWVFYDLAGKYPELRHLRILGNQHMNYSLDNILEGDSYMGSHWLASFALYALDRQGE